MWGELGYLTPELKEKLKKDWLEMLADAKHSRMSMRQPMAVRVRVISEPDGGWTITTHPTEDRPIQIGDEFEVGSVERGIAYWKSSAGARQQWMGAYFEVLGDSPPANHSCTCAIDVLMSHGCQCGGA